jgi:hypothetical protein
MKKILVIFALAISGLLSAQTGGTISGKVFKSDSSDVVPMATVKIEIAGETRGVKTDFSGNFKIDAVPSGVYTVKVESAIDGKREISGITVSTDQISELDVYLTNNLTIVEVIYRPKKIDINNVTKITSEELKHAIDIQNPNQMLATKSSEVSITENNQLIIRGSRPGDVIYYIDGVKQDNMASIPGIAIGGMTVYTGGVPAKYGDTTGGVVILETKGYFDLYYAWLASQK